MKKNRKTKLISQLRTKSSKVATDEFLTTMLSKHEAYDILGIAEWKSIPTIGTKVNTIKEKVLSDLLWRVI